MKVIEQNKKQEEEKKQAILDADKKIQ